MQPKSSRILRFKSSAPSYHELVRTSSHWYTADENALCGGGLSTSTKFPSSSKIPPASKQRSPLSFAIPSCHSLRPMIISFSDRGKLPLAIFQQRVDGNIVGTHFFHLSWHRHQLSPSIVLFLSPELALSMFLYLISEYMYTQLALKRIVIYKKRSDGQYSLSMQLFSQLCVFYLHRRSFGPGLWVESSAMRLSTSALIGPNAIPRDARSIVELETSSLNLQLVEGITS